MKTKQLFYSIDGLEPEQLYRNYAEYLEEQRKIRDFVPGNSAVVNAVAEQYLRDFDFKDPGIPAEAITINKFKVLVHLLVARNHSSFNRNLNAKILQDIVGHQYDLMLRSMSHKGIITKSDYYVPGKVSYLYTINRPYEVKRRPIKNIYVQKQLEKLSKKFSREEANNRVSWQQDKFINLYQKILDKVKLQQYHYDEFIEQLPNTERSKVAYHEVIIKFKNKLYNLSEDDRNRLYSTLTRCPKLLKNFLNIRFQTDINNSHPLLFSYFLINKYNIDFYIINDIYNIPYTNSIIYPNDSNNLCKMLTSRSQDYIKKKRIPRDVIAYVYFCSIGKFWDHFKSLPEFSHVPRFLVKIKLFEEVFYSNKLTSWQREFAKAFKLIYPTVYSLIIEYRKEAKTKHGEHLAHKMTRLESEIFREILQRTWDEGMETVNIHDALIVLDTKKNKNTTETQVDEIIKSVYRKYGLIATTSVDYFSIGKAENGLQVLNENQNKISELKEELYQSMLTMTDDTLFERTGNLLEGLEDGSIEIVFEGGEPFVVFNN